MESDDWLYLQGGVPASSTHGHAITGDAQTTDAVVVAQQDTHALASESIPDVAIVVVISREQKSSRDGERHGCDAAKDVIVGINIHLAICTQIKESAGRVIRACCKSIATWEEPIHENNKVEF